MQTFLPEPDMILSLERLDYRRLGKQRVESYQLIRAISGASKKGWLNHPCTKMWTGFLPALKLYYNLSIYEWESRGYNNNMALYDIDEESIVLPPWFGDAAFHRSHQSNLIRKLPAFYKKFWPTTPDNIEYVWPIPHSKSSSS